MSAVKLLMVEDATLVNPEEALPDPERVTVFPNGIEAAAFEASLPARRPAALAGKPLPLFSHATEGEYRELFTTLRESATLTPTYQTLMVLSVLLALAGSLIMRL